MNRNSRCGLSADEAERRLRQHGANEIAREEASSPLLLFLAQFRSPVVGLLLAACVVSAVLGEVADAIAIGAIVLLNGIVGFSTGPAPWTSPREGSPP